MIGLEGGRIDIGIELWWLTWNSGHDLLLYLTAR
jgi:hypothetical protein